MKTIALTPLLSLLLVSGCAWQDFDMPLHMYLPASFGATTTPKVNGRPNRAHDWVFAKALADDVAAALDAQMASTGRYMSVPTAATETPPDTNLVMHAPLHGLPPEPRNLLPQTAETLTN